MRSSRLKGRGGTLLDEFERRKQRFIRGKLDVEFRLDPQPQDLAPVARELSEFCAYVIDQWPKWKEDTEPFYGDVLARYVKLHNALRQLTGNPMAKLFVISAPDEPTAIILRGVPSDWYHLIQCPRCMVSDSEFTHAWTAISRPPWLAALVVQSPGTTTAVVGDSSITGRWCCER